MILTSRRSPGIYRPRVDEAFPYVSPFVLVVQPHPWYLARLPVLFRQTGRITYRPARTSSPFDLRLDLDLDQTVSVEQAANTRDTLGGTVRAPWSVVASDIAACIQPLSGREIAAAHRADGTEISHRVYLAEWPEGQRLDTRHRIIFGTRYLRVVTARDIDELGQLITVDCVERPA
jgi:head-tail adaptor